MSLKSLRYCVGLRTSSLEFSVKKSVLMRYYFRPLFIVLPLLVSACTIPAYDGNPLAQMTFDHVKPFSIYVASYEPVNMNSGVTHKLPDGFISDPSELILIT